jgi:hypothetical protein
MHQPVPASDEQDQLPIPPPGADHPTLVRWMASLPCDRPGSDKTWVLDVLRERQRRATARGLHADAGESMHQDVLDRIVDGEARHRQGPA